MDKKILWESTLAELQLNISTANYQTWFKGKTLITLVKDGVIEIGCNSTYVKNWLESRYQGQLKNILERVSGKRIDLMFSVDPNIKDVFKKSLSKKINTREDLELFKDSDKNIFRESLSEARLNPNFNFDSFVVGKSNQLAHAVAKAIVDNNKKIYNPYFIYGGVGVGKTHLIQAIAHESLSINSSLKVMYTSCEDFTNELVSSIQLKTTTNFKTKYRHLDLLIVDDVQFLEGREYTQEEIFHTFNALFAEGKQIVLASDRPPTSIRKLSDRLRSRFEGGMIADIGLPDTELREAVIIKKSQDLGVKLPSEIVKYLAESYQKNIRDLEGGLVRLLSYSKLTKEPISKRLVERIIGLTNKKVSRETKPKIILERVAQYFDLTVGDLKSPRRNASLVYPRQIAMFILREDLKTPLIEIASLFNKKDHTSVIYSVGKIKSAAKNSPKTREILGEIRKSVFTT